MPDQPKSCLGCPSYLTDAEASRHFNKGIGVPVCARFGKPIGNIHTDHAQRTVIAESLAEKCPAYGQPKPDIPDWENVDFTVSLPDPDTMIPDEQRDRPESVVSCSSCAFYVREDTVLNDMGWAAGMCSAKGKLILTNRQTWEARHCDVKSFGSPRHDTNGLHFLPQYQPDFKGIHDPARLFGETRKSLEIEPSEYPTDLDVSDDDEFNGIRAWRGVTNPRTGHTVYLPIFRRDYFDEDEQLLIPQTGDDQHPEDYLDHAQNTYRVGVIWMELDETPAFWGESGTGKTEFYRYMGWLMQLPFHRFAIKRSTELDELEGTKEFEPERGTYFRPGRFVKAWLRPGIGDVDEANTGKPEVWHFLRPIFDSSKMLIVDADDTGKPYKRNDFFFPGVAMNPAWDDKNIGAEEISDADARRLHHVRMGIPPDEIERKIINKRIERDGYEFPKDQLNLIQAIAADLREAVKDGGLPITWGVGNQLKVARAMKFFPVEECYKMAIADFLSPDDYEEFMNYVNTHIE